MNRLLTILTLALVGILVLGAAAGCGNTPEQKSVTSEGAAEEGAAPEVTEDAPPELPASPADVSGMKDWLAEAYPDAAWLGRIKKIEHVPGEVPESGGFRNAIVVTTDLDFASEQALGTEIQAALGEAKVGWAKQSVIRFADGNNIMAGDLVDMTP